MTSKSKDVAEDEGGEIFVPLNKLKKSSRNARKTGHSAASIEALAASIAAKGMLQNLVVEPKRDADDMETGFYLVTIGEGRRLAQLLRVKRKEIKKTEPIRCMLDTANDPHEISLDENVTREAMHPADQFEAFKALAEDKGFSVEEIAARFGVTAQVVKQRLRLGAVSPKLMQAYRAGDLNLDQLMAFAISENHERQEEVYGQLVYNKDPYHIRRMMIETHVPAHDRRAVFIGAEAYQEAGGTILRDLFTEDRGGYFEDAKLVSRLAFEKLEMMAEEVRAEGWKWAEAHIDFPHSHGLRRIYPKLPDLSDEDQAKYDALFAEHEALSTEAEQSDELAEEVIARLEELDAEMDAVHRPIFDPADIARCGLFVVLNHDGSPRIERGYIRPGDEPHPGKSRAGRRGSGERVTEDGEIIEDGEQVSEEGEDGNDDEGIKPLSDQMTRELTAYRTLGLRLALSENPDMALTVLTHALVAQSFYAAHERASSSCLDIRLTCSPLARHAPGIDDNPGSIRLAAQHANWAHQMPEDVTAFWDFVSSLDSDSRLALLAHCVTLGFVAVDLPWDRKPVALAQADDLAQVLSVDLSAIWWPTAQTYFGRVTKAQIIEAVREAVGDEAAGRIGSMKKQAMAEAAEQLLAGTGWLPKLLRTERPVCRGTSSADADAALTALEGVDSAAE